MDERDKERIVALTLKMVMGMVDRGEVDPEDEAEMKATALKCAPLAKAAYFAALEFLS